MKSICCRLSTTESGLEKRAREECKEGKFYLIKFLIEAFLAIGYTWYFRTLNISETVSLSSNVSFPFQRLEILINSHLNITTGIKYNNYKEIILNKKFINITEELKAYNISNLILNKEFEDFLSISFKVNENLDNLPEESGNIKIKNKIYSLNNSRNNISVDTWLRFKIFDIYDEVNSLLVKKKFKRYQYDIHSYSIQILDEPPYNFPIIDDNERVRYFYNKTDYNFGFYFSKRNHLNTIKVTTEPFFKKAFDVIGSIALITEIIIPFLFYLKDEIRIKMCCFNIKKKDGLKDNEIDVGNQNRELNEINV